jgi:hypothetical protein
MFFLEFVLCGGLMNSQDPVNNFGTVSPFWPPWSENNKSFLELATTVLIIVLYRSRCHVR